MANLVYLLAAIGSSAVLLVVLWLHYRQPQSTRAGIEGFQRELRALAPNSRRVHRVRRPPG